MTTAQKSRLDIHQIVTDKIVKAIEAGVAEWQMPWHRPGTSFSIPEPSFGAAPSSCPVQSCLPEAHICK